MSLVSAQALLWFLPLGGLIFLLYLLKMRRKEMQVPASFLWPKLTNEVRANSLFQRPKVTLLFILQMLAAALLITAFAHPQTRASTAVGQATVVVIDASASMAATDVKPTRQARAVEIVQKLVDSVRPGDRLSVIEAGPTPRVIFPLQDDPGQMRFALSRLQTYDAAGDMGSALRLAASLVAKSSSGKIVVLSDGDFGGVANFSPGKAQVVFQKIGTADDNSAVTALGLADSSSGPQLYCGLKNYGAEVSVGSLDIFADGDLVDSMKVQIPPKGTIGKTLPAPAGAKVFEARLNVGDDLSADDYAVCLKNSQAISVLLVSPGDLFLERALSLDPRVTLYKAPAFPSAGHYDVVVFDGVPESRVDAGGVLTFGSAGPASPVTLIGPSSNVVPSIAARRGQLLAGVNMDKMYIAKGQRVSPKSDAEVLAESSSGPLILQRKGPPRQLYVAFSPLDSDFPLRVAFPVFIDHALSFLAPRESSSSALQVAAGRTVAIRAGKGDLQLKHPDNSIETIRPENGQYVLRNLDKVGHFIAETSPPKDIYVTFADDTQSNIAPLDRPSLGSARPASTQVASHLADFWKPIVFLALLVLGTEWFVFARRS